MNIITGYKGTPHVTAQQDRDINSAIFTNGVYILNIGSKMAATIVSANEITIADGLVIAQGCAAEIARGTSESMTIDNGTQGMLRKDLIVLRYTKNASTGVEDMELDVIKGTPAASNPATPSHTTGSIADGDTTVDFPLYEVHLDGISIESVVRIPDIVAIAKQSTVTPLITTVTSLANKIGSVAMGTAATTITGAIKELLTKINTLTSNLSTTNNNVNAVEYKTDGIVRTYTYNVASGGRDYKQLAALGMYVFFVNGATTSNTVRGIYQVGVTSGNVLGIKAISAASNVAVEDAGNGLIRITNNSSLTLRVTFIRTN